MTLTLRVLGAATPYPQPDQPCSGYLLQTPTTSLLIDLGLAVWPALLRYIDPARLDALWISHLHPDHSGDLLAAYQWAANTDGAPRLPVIGPAKWWERIGAALPVADGADQLRRLFDVREHDEAPGRVGDLTLTAAPVRHSVPTHGLRMTHNGVTVAYSADSAPCDALTDLAHGADVFLCEAGSAAPGNAYHCTPEDAARMARGAKRLILTHLAPALSPRDALRRAPGATIARPGLVLGLQAS